MITRVKMCGMTRADDVQAAVELGAAAIGLIFYPQSPRAVTIEQAQGIIAELPPFITIVGVFVDADQEYVTEAIKQIPLDLLQFHGHESAVYCRRFHRPYIKAIAMHKETDLMKECTTYADAKALLLDAQQKDKPGGTGTRFEWSLVPKHLPKPIILAGGLTPENVSRAIIEVQPYAVDVTSGIEANKGIKDIHKMRQFMTAVNHITADA